MPTLVRTRDEIDRVIDWTINEEGQGRTRYPGMSYEEGVRDAIDWLLGDSDEAPDEE